MQWRVRGGRGHAVLLLGVLAAVAVNGSGEAPVSCQQLGLRVSRVELDAAVKDIVWLTGQVVLIITKKNTLYRSGDDGRTFRSVMDQLEDSETEEAPYANGVMGMFPSDADPRRVFIKGGGKVHWVTTDGGRTFHVRRMGMAVGDVKMHRSNPECILAGRLSDRCLGVTAQGFCYNSLYVSYDFGRSWKEAVSYVQQFDWGPHDRTVIYSAYEHSNGHQFLQETSRLNVYRSTDMLRTERNTRLVVHKGVGFKVSKSGVYVAVATEGGTMELFVSRDDAQSFLPAVFPQVLSQTRYTIMDQDDGTVFVSVEHPRNAQVQSDASESISDSVTVGDIYASVADGEVLFQDDFENGLSRWRGKHESAVPSNSRVVDDPLCVGGTGRGGKDWEGTGCRGKVLKMEDCVGEGDAFSLETFTCSVTFPCKVSFWFLGLAWQGFADGFPGRHVWSAAGDDEERGNHHKTSTVRDRWTRVEYVFPRRHSEFVWEEGGKRLGGHGDRGRHVISRVRLMLEAHAASCNNTYFDDIRITRARTEDYVMALRDSTRDNTGHVDLHMARGLPGILFGNIMTKEEEMRSLRTSDMGSEWLPLVPPTNAESPHCEWNARKGKWLNEGGETCGLHLHMGHKIKGAPGRWEFRMHKEADRRFGALLTNEHAMGLVLATGNVGTFLEQEPEEATTFVSRDAGLTWSKVMDGSAVYDIGDQGSLILAARSHEPTSEVTLSVDSGVSFRTCQLTGEQEILEVHDILAEPNATSTNFLVLGVDDGTDDAQVYSVDFSMLFPRQCSDADMAGDPGSDFELWSPKESNGKTRGCLLGRELQYVRRKAGARCYVGETPIATLERSCPCTESDYQCDFCYERVGEDKSRSSDVRLRSPVRAR